MLHCSESIGAYRRIAQTLPLPLAVERQLRHETRVRVAHNSTWIENRTLALQEAQAIIADKAIKDPSRAHSQAAVEVRNYFQALDVLDRHIGRPCNEGFIQDLHAVIMKGGQQGRPKLRSEYRQTNVRIGNFTYVPPAWEDVPALMHDLADWACGPGLELPRMLFAGILAYQFVTIHPFADGNGRTCRALATWALRSGDENHVVDPIGLLNVEELYAQNLDGYYQALQMGCHFSYYDANEYGSRSDPDLSPWLDYFTTMLARSAGLVTDSILAHVVAAHPSAGVDPLGDLPRTFRRLLARLSDPTVQIAVADVVDWFQISDRTARVWLKDWTSAGHLLPANAASQRVHAYVLAPQLVAILNHQVGSP